MPLWSNTDAFNEASGFPREWGAWARAQFPEWLNRANRYGDQGDWYQQQLSDYWWGQLNDGYASPEDIAGAGQRATPWITSAVNSRNANMDQIGDIWAGRRSVDSLFDPIRDRYNDWAGDITRTGEMSQSEIDRLFRDLLATDEGTNREIMGGIGDTFGRIDSGINDTFGGLRRASSRTGQDLLSATGAAYSGMRDDSGRTFDGLTDSLNSTYGDLESRTDGTFGQLAGDLGSTEGAIRQEIERLRPNSEFAQARVGRSWAPVVSNVAQRLRTLGLTPNSLQGMSAMADVESRRAAAMDDAAVEQNQSIANQLNQMRLWGYGQRADLGLGELDRMTDLGLGRQAGRERLGLQSLLNRQGLTEREQGIGRDLVTDALMRDINLGIGQNDRSNTSAIQAMAAANAERERALMNRQGIAQNRSAGTLNNLTNQYGITADWRNSLNNMDMAAYDAHLRDILGSQDILRERNTNDLTNVNLLNQQYGIGNEWYGNQYNRRDAAANAMGNLMNTNYGQRQNATSNAMGWGNTAANAYDTARNYDANRGNVGWRIAGAVAQPLLSRIPGLSSFIPALGNITGTNQQNGGTWQGRAGGGAGGYGGFGTPPFVPTRYSNTAASYPQVSQWQNLSRNLFGNLRMP